MISNNAGTVLRETIKDQLAVRKWRELNYATDREFDLLCEWSEREGIECPEEICPVLWCVRCDMHMIVPELCPSDCPNPLMTPERKENAERRKRLWKGPR